MMGAYDRLSKNIDAINDIISGKISDKEYREVMALEAEMLGAAATMNELGTDAVLVVRCLECRNCSKSDFAGFWHCDAWGQDVNMTVHNPEKYFCAEGERR
ncbi:MAG: hypothetical protein J6Y20_07365 [Lachnospiraceae bacterium]|nr:hypothetical protein [Lachnospiraceae bacterium]